MTETTKTFGRALADHRRHLWWTQAQLALAAKTAPTYLSGVETGKRPVPAADLRERLYDALGLTLKERGVLERLARAQRVCPTCGKAEGV